MSVSARLEIRVDPESKARVVRAAALTGSPVSAFVRDAVEERAQRVLDAHQVQTRVPAGFFDKILDALDAPTEPSHALRRAARRAGTVVVRD